MGIVFDGKKATVYELGDEPWVVAHRELRDGVWRWIGEDGREVMGITRSDLDDALVAYVEEDLETWPISKLASWLRWNDPNGDYRYDEERYDDEEDYRGALIDSVLEAVEVDDAETPVEIRTAANR